MILEEVKKLKASKEYSLIKKDLVTQLELKKADTPAFMSQVNDYMAMWVTKELLIKDIETRGTYVEYNNGGNQMGTRTNGSVMDQIKVNLQMIKTLDSLDINTRNIRSDTDDEL